MDRRSLIKNIFGKESGVTEEDIKVKVMGILKESVFIDYKRVDGSNKRITKNESRNLIMPEITAFLNKMSPEGGVLALGIDAKDKIPTDIIGVDGSAIINDSALRDWILNDISSVPRALEFPIIEIETVVIENSKKVYFIEIHPADLNVLYFYRGDGSAYVREIDTTRKLSLEESIRIIDVKRTAKLYANLEQIDFRIEDDFAIYKVKIVFNNLGNKPAANVSGMYLFNTDSAKNKCEHIDIEFFDTKIIMETSNINACSRSFQQDFKRPFYPGRPVVVGFFNIRFLRSVPMFLILEIDEQNGRTKQIFYFSGVELKKSFEYFSSY